MASPTAGLGALNLTSSYKLLHAFRGLQASTLTFLTPMQITTPIFLRVSTITSRGAQAVVPVLKLHNIQHYPYITQSIHPDLTANFIKFISSACLRP